MPRHHLKKFKNNPNIKIVLGDFFAHKGKYDLIIEQTFFCALPPTMRQKFVWKMHQLLADEGKLAGLLFNRAFEPENANDETLWGKYRAEYPSTSKLPAIDLV